MPGDAHPYADTYVGGYTCTLRDTQSNTLTQSQSSKHTGGKKTHSLQQEANKRQLAVWECWGIGRWGSLLPDILLISLLPSPLMALIQILHFLYSCFKKLPSNPLHLYSLPPYHITFLLPVCCLDYSKDQGSLLSDLSSNPSSMRLPARGNL